MEQKLASQSIASQCVFADQSFRPTNCLQESGTRSVGPQVRQLPESESLEDSRPTLMRPFRNNKHCMGCVAKAAKTTALFFMATLLRVFRLLVSAGRVDKAARAVFIVMANPVR